MTAHRLSRSLVTVLMFFPVAGFSHAADKAGQLLKYVPEDVNTLAVVRVEEILKSPRGQREGWSKKSAAEFLGGVLMVPPWLDVAVRASHVHPGAPESSWSVGLMPWPEGISIENLARQENASVQTIAGKKAVHAELRRAYFTELVPGVLGVMNPGYRQDLARWIRSSQSRREPEISPYLQDVAKETEGQVVMAIDMDEMLEPRLIELRLKSSSALRGNSSEIKKLAELMRHLKGIRFYAQVEEETTAGVRFDFSVPVGSVAGYLKDMLIEFLEDSGAVLEDLDESVVLVGEQHVELRMTLSDSGLRRIMSLIVSPPPAAILQGREQPRVATRIDSFQPSQSYFQAVREILEDLKRSNRKAKNYAKTAQWHENFADKIEQLPVKDVDRQLRDYGSSVRNKLHALAASLRGVAIDVNVLERTITYKRELVSGYEYVHPWGWYGHRPHRWNVTSNLKEVRERQADAIREGAKERQKIWTMLDEEQRSVREKMIARFSEEFDPPKRKR